MTDAGSGRTEPRVLASAVAILALVPFAAGLDGVLNGATMTGVSQAAVGSGLDSHVRYLSGLLLGIGVAFWTTVPRIEASGPRFRLLSAIVLAGGLARLLGVVENGLPPAPMVFGLVMETIVTPLLCLWQWRVERRHRE